MNDAEEKLRKIESMPMGQRDVLMDTCGHLVDLSAAALEFVEIVAIESKSKPFDPIVVMANALARWKARMRSN